MTRFQGAGDILQSGEAVARARYDLTSTVQRANTGLENVERLSSMEGSVTILTGYIDIGDRYLLRIESGKVVELIIYNIISAGRPHPMYKVRVVGDLEE